MNEKGIKARTMDMQGLVDYQEGATVSRTLIDKQEGTVTVFSFDRDQRLSEHTVPFDALVQVLEGRAEITISGEKHEVSQGQMIIMPAGQPHSLKAPEKFKMMLVMVRT